MPYDPPGKDPTGNPHPPPPPPQPALAAGFTACSLCGALLAVSYEAIHNQWHERLRRAVDEMGTLDE